MRLSAQFTQQGVFDLFPGYVSHMKNPALGMTALFAKIKLAMSRNLTFIELQTELSQLADALRTFSHNRAYDSFVTQTRSRFKRVTHVQFKRIFIARHAGDPALRPSGVCVGALAFRHHSHRTVHCHFQRKTQAGNTAADHHEIVFLHDREAAILPAGTKCSNTQIELSRRDVFLHPKRILSIRRVFPKNTATASNEFVLTVLIGRKVSASTSST